MANVDLFYALNDLCTYLQYLEDSASASAIADSMINDRVGTAFNDGKYSAYVDAHERISVLIEDYFPDIYTGAGLRHKRPLDNRQDG